MLTWERSSSQWERDRDYATLDRWRIGRMGPKNVKQKDSCTRAGYSLGSSGGSNSISIGA
jgi:hypothetical protein